MKRVMITVLIRSKPVLRSDGSHDDNGDDDGDGLEKETVLLSPWSMSSLLLLSLLLLLLFV